MFMEESCLVCDGYFFLVIVMGIVWKVGWLGWIDWIVVVRWLIFFFVEFDLGFVVGFGVDFGLGFGVGFGVGFVWDFGLGFVWGFGGGFVDVFVVGLGVGFGYVGLIDVWGFVEFCLVDVDDCEVLFEVGVLVFEDEVVFFFFCEDFVGFFCGVDVFEENSWKLFWWVIVVLWLVKGDEVVCEVIV